jgi:hypothetical protein
MDPSPFFEKELDADAEEFIVGWAKELPSQDDIKLVVHVVVPGGAREVENVVEEAVHNFFRYRAAVFRRQLGQLTRNGWKDLARGLLVLGGSIIVANLLESWGETPWLVIVKESIIIGGWVAMWRPIEILLYERWPIKDLCALYEKLSGIPVEVRVGAGH